MTILSLSPLTVLDATPVEAAKAAKAGGFNAIGLRLITQHYMRVDLINKPNEVKEVVSFCKDNGMAIFDIEGFTLIPDVDFEHFARAVDTAAELGASYLLSSGFDHEFGRLVTNLNRLCALAGNVGIRVGFEFMPYRLTRTLQEALRVKRKVEADNIGIIIDALHFHRSGGHPEELASLGEDELAYIQLCDAPVLRPPIEKVPYEARENRLYPGEGGIWLDELVTSAPEGMAFTVEAPSLEYSQLTPEERARLAGEKTRDLFNRNGRKF